MSRQKARRLTITGFFILSLLATSAAGLLAQESEESHTAGVSVLDAPTKTVVFSNPRPPGTTAPFYSHGYLIQIKHHTDIRPAPNVFLYNSSGRLEHKIAVWPERANKLYLTSVDVGAGLQMVFAGRVRENNGAAVNFVATADLDGNNTSYFSTGNYLATQIAQADDGSIWSVGAEHAELSETTASWKNYDVLRHYSSTGILLQHFLPRWGPRTAYVVKQATTPNNIKLRAFDAHDTPIAEYTAPFWGPQGGYTKPSTVSTQSWLKVVNDGVVLYDGRSGTLYRCGTANPSVTTKGVDIQDTLDDLITGFAVSTDGSIYASMRAHNREHPQTPGGLFKLNLAGSLGLARWSRIRQNEISRLGARKRFVVFGSDGASIVYGASGGDTYWSEVNESRSREGR